jgi:hypothetical protein
MGPELAVAVVAAVVVVAALSTWRALHQAKLQEERELRAKGCWCPAGSDGLHLPGCPVDPEQEAGA